MFDFNRFSDNPRKALGLSRQEAMRLGHDYIGTEHILLGLLRMGSGCVLDVLLNLDIDLEALRDAVESAVTRGSANVIEGQLPFTPGAKRVLEFAYEESTKLGHGHIGSEHLVLGLLREQKGLAAPALSAAGARIDDVREEVCELVHETYDPTPPTFLFMGRHDEAIPDEAVAEIQRVLHEEHCMPVKSGRRPDLLLVFDPRAEAERWFRLGLAVANRIPIVLFLREGEFVHRLLADHAVAVHLDGELAENLRAFLRS
ncbi:MAG: Clp protease N-terminal domain-containing protein [Planctomycetota bacterium]